MWMMRWACSAMSASWVTSTMVLPFWCSSAKSVMISWPVCESRLPVASSARMMEGSLTRARGRAHVGHILAAIDVKVHATQGMRLLRAHLVGLPQVFGADHAVLRRSLQGVLGNGGELCCHAFLLVGATQKKSSLYLDAEQRPAFTLLPCCPWNYPVSPRPRCSMCAA